MQLATQPSVFCVNTELRQLVCDSDMVSLPVCPLQRLILFQMGGWGRVGSLSDCVCSITQKWFWSQTCVTNRSNNRAELLSEPGSVVLWSSQGLRSERRDCTAAWDAHGQNQTKGKVWHFWKIVSVDLSESKRSRLVQLIPLKSWQTMWILHRPAGRAWKYCFGHHLKGFYDKKFPPAKNKNLQLSPYFTVSYHDEQKL